MKIESWEISVLRVIIDLGREGCLEDIYEKIKRYEVITPKLGENWGNQPYYYHYVRSVIVKLKKKGELEHINKGVYSITEKGLDRIGRLEAIEEI